MKAKICYAHDTFSIRRQGKHAERASYMVQIMHKWLWEQMVSCVVPKRRPRWKTIAWAQSTNNCIFNFRTQSFEIPHSLLVEERTDPRTEISTTEAWQQFMNKRKNYTIRMICQNKQHAKADCCDPGKQSDFVLVIIDSYSRWPEVTSIVDAELSING